MRLCAAAHQYRSPVMNRVCRIFTAVVIVTFAGWAKADDRKPQAPVAKPAATSAEAVEAVVTASQQPVRKAVPLEQPNDSDAFMDDLAARCKALKPLLSESSQEVLNAYIDFAATAKAHDVVARKHFGKNLDKAQDYMPAATIALRMTLASTLLGQTPEGKTEVIRKTEKTATEVVFELCWRVGERDATATVNETLVAVKEKAGWKILQPTRRVPFGLGMLGDQPPKAEPPEVWGAEKVRKSNKQMIQTLKAMSGGVERLTGEVEAGKYRKANKYVQAVYDLAVAGK